MVLSCIESLEVLAIQNLSSFANNIRGRHFCYFNGGSGGQGPGDLVGAFLSSGLERNDKLVFVLPHRNQQVETDWFVSKGLDLTPYLEQGQVAIFDVWDVFLHRGGNCVAGAVEFLKEAERQAAEEGYAGINLVVDMSSVLEVLPLSRVLEYESALNLFLDTNNCSVLCRYDSDRLEPGTLQGILGTHPFVILGEEVHHNPFFVSVGGSPSEQLADGLRRLFGEKGEAEDSGEKAMPESSDSRTDGFPVTTESTTKGGFASEGDKQSDTAACDPPVAETEPETKVSPSTESPEEVLDSFLKTLLESTASLSSEGSQEGKSAFPKRSAESEIAADSAPGTKSGYPAAELDAILKEIMDSLRESRQSPPKHETDLFSESVPGSQSDNLDTVLKNMLDSLPEVPEESGTGRPAGTETEPQHEPSQEGGLGLALKFGQKPVSEPELLDSMPMAVFILDRVGKVIDWNRAAERFFGWTGGEVVGEYAPVVTEEKRTEFDTQMERVLGGETIFEAQTTCRKKSGRAVVSMSMAPLRDDRGGVAGVVVVAEDFTRIKKDAGTPHFSFLVENSRDIIFRIQLQPERKFEYISPAIKTISGYSPEEFYADFGLCVRLMEGTHRDLWEKTLEGNVDFSEPLLLQCSGRDGRKIWVEQRIVPTYEDRKLTYLEGIGRDVTDRKRMEERLKFLTLFDPLTRLYNRAYFEQEMSRLQDGRHDPVGVVMCDVDGLKIINDSLGHDKGDQHLRLAAKMIRESFRESDVVARVGGDEFAVVVANATSSFIQGARRRIERSVEKYNAQTKGVPLSISVGCAIRTDVSVTMEELLREADSNMYKEKFYYKQHARSMITKTLMQVMEKKDYVDEGHGDRVQELVVEMATLLNLSQRSISHLCLLAQFHDIGKVGVQDHILFKRGPLNPQERAEMERHCEIGHRIALSAPDLAPIADWILKHHEWWNGEGYPLGLSGEEIPVECRILAIADAYDSMTSLRSHRGPMSHTEAMAELKQCAGTQFDPALVEKLVEVFERKNR